MTEYDPTTTYVITGYRYDTRDGHWHSAYAARNLHGARVAQVLADLERSSAVLWRDLVASREVF